MYAPTITQEENALPAPEDLSNVELIRWMKFTKKTIASTSAAALSVGAVASMYLQELSDEAASRRVRAR